MIHFNDYEFYDENRFEVHDIEGCLGRYKAVRNGYLVLRTRKKFWNPITVLIKSSLTGLERVKTVHLSYANASKIF